MNNDSKSILVAGFNTRPLAYSLSKAGYEVFAVDFFGDLDLYPYVKEAIIITEELGKNYDSIKDSYHNYIADFTIKMLEKNPQVKSLIIGSGLDDAFEQRKIILNHIQRKNLNILDLNNDIQAIQKARNIRMIYQVLESNEYEVPETIFPERMDDFYKFKQFPFILKKFRSSGGININKIKDEDNLNSFLKILKSNEADLSEWLAQEYIDGIPLSCTVISNGSNSEIVSINRQIIGEKFLNSPKEFMYCGNIVPARISPKTKETISYISLMLTRELKLKGINGFDFVVKNQCPYLMEINPRIPGSVRASEMALNINLLDLHVQSFDKDNWGSICRSIKNPKPTQFATKLILYAPQEISKNQLMEINKLENVHDKTHPKTSLNKFDPVCTVLFGANTFSESYFGALKIVDQIYELLSKG